MCGETCLDCPRRVHAPQTAQGAAVWRLVQQHLVGQWRYVATIEATVPVGLDMTAALATARALGIDELAVAELLPAIEVAAITAEKG